MRKDRKLSLLRTKTKEQLHSTTNCVTMKFKENRLISFCLIVILIIINCYNSQCCDLEQLTETGHRSLKSIEHDVQNSQIVFRGITTNVYGSAVHVIRNGVVNSNRNNRKYSGRTESRSDRKQNGGGNIRDRSWDKSDQLAAVDNYNTHSQDMQKKNYQFSSAVAAASTLPQRLTSTSSTSNMGATTDRDIKNVKETTVDGGKMKISTTFGGKDVFIRNTQQQNGGGGDGGGGSSDRKQSPSSSQRLMEDGAGVVSDESIQDKIGSGSPYYYQPYSHHHVDEQEQQYQDDVVTGVDTPSDDIIEDDIRGVFTAYFELINTYKGEQMLAKWDANSFSAPNRRVNVTFFEATTECLPSAGVPREYIVFCELQGNDLQAISVVRWSDENELRVWNALGWGTWSDWSACSVSCGNGIQQRSRFCTFQNTEQDRCPGPNIEQRKCNSFSCASVVNPLALEDRRFFHPSRSQWARVPDRPDAWRLQPNAYIWVPVSQVFPASPIKSSYSSFPKEFTVFVTLRIQNDTTMGTLWSLRSRRQQDAYLSLELAGSLGVNLVHANGANGTDVVRIPANLGDGMWHHLALGIKDDSTVNTYVDCEWLRTDILKKDALNTPEDADLIIGYLFTGDLEQLVIVPDADIVSQQCSSVRTPIADPSLESRMPHLQYNNNKIKSNQQFDFLTTTIKPVITSEYTTELINYENIFGENRQKNPSEIVKIDNNNDQYRIENNRDVTTKFDPTNIHWNIVPKKGPQIITNNNGTTLIKQRTGQRQRSRGQRKGQHHHHKKSKKKIQRNQHQNVTRSY